MPFVDVAGAKSNKMHNFDVYQREHSPEDAISPTKVVVDGLFFDFNASKNDYSGAFCSVRVRSAEYGTHS